MIIGKLQFPIFNVYKSWRGSSIAEEVLTLLFSWTCAILGLLAFLFFTKTATEYSRHWFLLWFVSAYLGLIFSRITLRMVLHSIRNRGLNQRHIVLVGGSPLNQQVTKKLESSSWMGLKIAGYFYHNNENQDLEYLGDIDTVVQYVEQHDIDQVWITLPLTQMDKIERLSRQLHSVTVDVMLIPDIASLRLLNYSTGAPCYLTKFRDSCRHNSFTYAADGRCPERPASATTTHKSRFVITTSLAGRLFGMQFLLLSRAASTRRISELPCRLSGTKNHHFAK
ncbi:hypothetical protein BMR08_11210, partial [Methylococcaceae bacterium CS2]